MAEEVTAGGVRVLVLKQPGADPQTEVKRGEKFINVQHARNTLTRRRRLRNSPGRC